MWSLLILISLRAKLDENLQLRYSELLSLQKMYETEKSETQRIERQVQELALEIASKEEELEVLRSQRVKQTSGFGLAGSQQLPTQFGSQ